MDPLTNEATSSTATDGGIQPFAGFDIFSFIVSFWEGGDGSGVMSGIIGFFNSLWTIFAVLAFLISIVLLVLYVFAATRRNLYISLMTQKLRDEEKLFDELYRSQPKNSRLQDVYTHTESDNPNDWKLAIIEADIILDDSLKKKGFIGGSLGERLKSLSPNQLATLNDAWEAHKIRNKIAHEGADFVLTKRLVHETISRYQRVFDELGLT
jgi:hypothetical protein